MRSRITLAIVILFISIISTNAQTFYNLNFQQACDTSKTGLCNWNLTFGAKGSVTQDNLNGTACMMLQATKENAVTWAEQSSQVNFSKGMQLLTLSAFVKTENVEGKGAGFNINLYDKEGNYITFKDMGQRYSLDWIRGTTEWKQYSLSVVCPVETGKINIGAILYGKGRVWFKDYKVSFSKIRNRKPSALALKYINSACDTIYNHSLLRDSINIKKLKKEALKIAGPAEKYTDCYTAVQYLIESLRPYGDNHSFFMKANEYTNWQTNGSLISKVKFPVYKIIDSCGYIQIPGFHSGNQKTILAFADSLQHAISILNKAGIKGWIIDLRQNDGGNQEPMIAGLGPLFSAEKLGSLVDQYGKSQSWYYNNGKYWGDGYDGWNVTNPTALTNSLPVAVITGNQTGSSGEIVTISFIGNAHTKSFGQPTGGFTTGTIDYELMDGSRIFLASTIMADRNGKQYHGSIMPDVLIEQKAGEDTGIVLKTAEQWINTGN